MFLKYGQTWWVIPKLLYVGQSQQSCETSHTCLNDGWYVGGQILSALWGVTVGCGAGARD